MVKWSDREIERLQANPTLTTFELAVTLDRTMDSVQKARNRYGMPYQESYLDRTAVKDLLDSMPVPIRHFFKAGGWFHNYGETLEFEAGHNWIVTGDWQLPAAQYDFLVLMCAYAKKYIPKGDRNIAIVGDFVNGDAFSKWKNIVRPPDWQTEIDTFRHVIYMVFDTFDRVVFMPGNHEYRWLKELKGESTFSAMMLGALEGVKNAPEVLFTPVDRIIIHNANPHNQYDWLVCHGENFSVNALKVADEYTWAHNKNIIIHHQHHWAGGIHRYGRQEIIDNGTICNQDSLAYKSISTGKGTNFELGFVHLKPTGYATRLGSSMVTDWDELLPMNEDTEN